MGRYSFLFVGEETEAIENQVVDEQGFKDKLPPGSR
jgi:hypothetical protein